MHIPETAESVPHSPLALLHSGPSGPPEPGVVAACLLGVGFMGWGPDVGLGTLALWGEALRL